MKISETTTQAPPTAIEGGAAANDELVAVAMSGGLDSSFVAALYAQQQRRALGLSMLLWDEVHVPRHGRCCGALDLGDARTVAEQVGLPHYTLRLDEEFREKVVDPFVQDYLDGRTPSPCVRCNTFIKFDLLLERAAALGAARVATGHYARILPGAGSRTGEWELHTALDTSKDQSYFLFELTQDQLQRIEFPLGEMSKGAVRSSARDLGLVVAEKGESMEVCFVGSGVQEFVEQQVAARPTAFRRPNEESLQREQTSGAEIVDQQGRLLGAGAPYYRYTVGQRRGLGLASQERLYVLGVDATENRVTVGDRTALRSTGLRGERLHWIGTPPDGEIEATVRIRSRHPGAAARIRPLSDGQVDIDFEEPQSAVTPGQAAVFYDGTRVLGGCWIETGRARSG